MRPLAALAALLPILGCGAIESRAKLVEFVSDPPGATVTLDPRLDCEPFVTPATIRLSRWVDKAKLRVAIEVRLSDHEPYIGELPSSATDSFAAFSPLPYKPRRAWTGPSPATRVSPASADPSPS